MMNFETTNLNENSLKKESRSYDTTTPSNDVQNSKNISSGDGGTKACEIHPHGPTPCINNVNIINDSTFPGDMTVKEKINWLEKKIHGLKNIVNGNEIWILSKDGHAMKVKCLLTTNQLPECKGLGIPSTVKFLQQMKKSLLSAGVTEDDWVALASSRLRGNLRGAWEMKRKGSPNMNWSEFTDFVVSYVNRKRRTKGDDRRAMKKGYINMEDFLLIYKQETD